MGAKKIEFIKGHMGGNEIVLLYGDQIPAGQELRVGASVLVAPSIRGHNSGLMYRSETAAIRVRILDGSSWKYKRYIGMCGGLTQVLGKAIVEAGVGSRFGLAIEEPEADVDLETDVGLVRLRIRHRDGQVERVFTDMTAFVRECYALGIEHIQVAKIDALRVGRFLVINGDAIRRVYPDVMFEHMGEREFRIFQEAQREFDAYMGQETPNFALYDLHSKTHSGRLMFPHGLDLKYYEPSCGTGCVAVGLAMVEYREVEGNGPVVLTFEAGGDIFRLGGPDTMELRLTIRNGKVIQACFSHSSVAILATGEIWI